MTAELCTACKSGEHDNCSGWCFCDCQPAVKGSGIDPAICPSCGRRPTGSQCPISPTIGGCTFSLSLFPLRAETPHNPQPPHDPDGGSDET